MKRILKKNVLKKIITGVLLVVSLAAFTGCGSEKSGVNDKKATSTQAKSSTKIIVGTTGLTPGSSEHNNDNTKDGGVQGTDIDIMKEIAKRNNWEIEWRIAPVSALFGMLDNGSIDTIANCIAANKARAQKYNFDDPYAYGSYSLVAKQDGPKLNSVEALKGKKCSVLAGADQRISLEEWNQKKNLGIEIISLDDNGAVLQGMLNGTADMAFIGTTAAALANSSLNLNLQIYDPGIRNYQLIHPFRKDEKSDKIREVINKTIHAMRDDGTLKKIYMKWYGVDLTVDNTAKKK